MLAIRTPLSGALALILLAAPAAAQHADHDPAQHAAAAPSPALGGQAAFATITEVVRILIADTTTDWSKVDIERLRQHLIDMDEVTLRARVTATPVSGGLRMEVKGTGRTRDAIRSMAREHAAMTSRSAMSASVTESADGVVLTVLATDVRDARTVQRIRALGFIGWLAQPEHHAEHHVAIARGVMGAQHR
jgi:hypothetical protein